MKNVTVTMQDSVAEWARMEAARQNTSVSRLLGELLAEKMQHDDLYARAMREALASSCCIFSASNSPSRRDTLVFWRAASMRAHSATLSCIDTVTFFIAPPATARWYTKFV